MLIPRTVLGVKLLVPLPVDADRAVLADEYRILDKLLVVPHGEVALEHYRLADEDDFGVRPEERRRKHRVDDALKKRLDRRHGLEDAHRAARGLQNQLDVTRSYLLGGDVELQHGELLEQHDRVVQPHRRSVRLAFLAVVFLIFEIFRFSVDLRGAVLAGTGRSLADGSSRRPGRLGPRVPHETRQEVVEEHRRPVNGAEMSPVRTVLRYLLKHTIDRRIN